MTTTGDIVAKLWSLCHVLREKIIFNIAVSHPEGVPHVSDETEYEGQVERDRSHKPEISKLVRLQVQLVFKKKTDRDVDQTAMGRSEGEQYNQYAEIEENPLPHQRR